MSAQQELAAMAAVASALEALDADATARVLRWASDRFGQHDPRPVDGGAAAAPDAEPGGARFGDIHALFEEGSPTTDAQRALLAGYWFQVHEGDASFSGAKINDSLRQMGVGATNIAAVFSKLIARKPAALVQQVSKSGRSQQARKQYRLTTAGIAAARDVIASSAEE